MNANEETNRKFNKLQKDLSNDDVRVHWMGDLVRLYVETDSGTKTLTAFGAGNAMAKIQLWCVKNNYRCSAIRNGRIHI